MNRLPTRGLGLALLVIGLFPVYRTMGSGGGAPFRQGLVEMAEGALQFTWWGSLLVISLGVLLAILLPTGAIRLGRACLAPLTRPPLPVFAASAALLALILSLGIWEFLYEGLFTRVDEMVSAIQARYLASGHLTSPPLGFPEAWLVPNTLMVEEGWVSQYPPSHLLFMAVFYRLGAPWLFGPVMMGIMVWLLALSFPRLLPGRETTARTAGLLTAVSPFLLFLAPGGLSHITAGVAGAALLYTALRARDGHPAWAIAAGSAVGVMVSARPLIGLVLGAAILLTLWLPERKQKGLGWGGRRVALTLVGGLPFALLLGLYNQRVFGHWAEFGYTAAFGSNHGLGFHLDPWGYLYGLREAIGFTSMDFLSAGSQLLETPLPPTLFIGAYLLLGPRLPAGSGTLLAWGFLPVFANAFYWFHEPRMLFEAAPAWICLSVLCVAETMRLSEVVEGTRARLGQAIAWAAVLSLLSAGAWGIPGRWQVYDWTSETLRRIQIPSLPSGVPSLVFVHTSWNERLSSRLQGAGGMRQDSVVSALRRNTSCDLQTFSDAREIRIRDGRDDLPLPPIDSTLEIGAPGDIQLFQGGGGNTVRTRAGETLTSECRRQVEADRFGSVALAPLLWQGDLPGLESGLPMFVRDLGPEINNEIMALFPNRVAFVFTPTQPGGSPEVVPYQEAMEVLWGTGT